MKLFCYIDSRYNVVSRDQTDIVCSSNVCENMDQLKTALRLVNDDTRLVTCQVSSKHECTMDDFLYNLVQYRCEIVSVDANISTYKIVSQERKYLDLMRDVKRFGQLKSDRTGTGTYSMFGKHMQFDLSGNVLPLITTKKTFFSGVVKELLWFLRGQTNSKILDEQGVRIWNGNGSLENLQRLGFTDREEGDLGPIYGYQWRHWGRPYNGSGSVSGKDQIGEIISTLRHNPESRRMILSAWNVSDVPQMALPPCHVMCQFYVTGKRLHCNMYQRSADLFLGVPFNIASYALLTHMIAHVTGFTAERLTMFFGDCHVYTNHLDQVEEQISRTEFPFPVLVMSDGVRDIDDFGVSDLSLSGYTYHPAIAAPMAV